MRLILILLSLALSLFPAPPQRIVSTGPSITEILFALGLGPKSCRRYPVLHVSIGSAED